MDLVCERARRGLDCEKTAWRYDQFESSFLAFVEKLDLDRVLRDDNNFTDLENELEALRGQLAGKLEQREVTYALFAKTKDGNAADFVGTKLNELEAQREQLESVIHQKENALAAAKAEASDLRRGKDEIKQLINRLNGKDSYVLRAQVAAQIKSLVSSLVIGSAGYKPSKIDGDIVNPMAHLTADESKIRGRYFRVEFKDGLMQRVVPFEDEPLDFDQVTHI